MSGHRIIKLIKEFDFAHNQMDYALMMSSKAKGEEKEEWETEESTYEYEIINIAEKIKKLEPSKYMMDKYSELEYILEWA